VKAGQRVVVDLNNNGAMKTRDFKRGLTLGPQTRFEAGVASAMGAIAPVTAQLSASQAQTDCGQSAVLNWKSADAVDTSITSIGNVPASGDRTVSPMQTTTYELTAKGPGGVAKQAAMINVNTQPTVAFSLNQPDVRYQQIGDKVVRQDSATLNWSTSNASAVTIQPFGSVAASGSKSIAAAPDRTNAGLSSREVTYTLHATNACGGTTTRTATLHIVGTIEPPPPVTLASLFYPTNYPDRRHPKVGLVSSEKQVLEKAAATFKNHEQYDQQQNKLMVVGHADRRGPDKYNQALGERRAELVKNFLIADGIAADKIEIRSEGKNQPLDEKAVETLQTKDAQHPQKWMTSREQATLLAYNRRVDIILEPTGQKSTEAFPNDAPDARTLWQRPEPSLKAVESASKMPSGSEQTQVSSLSK